MIRKAFVIFLFFSLTLANCTALNTGATLGVTANTNPTPDYSDIFRVWGQGGAIYHNVSNPGAPGNARTEKKGEACAHSVLGLVAFGDASIVSASDQVGITKIATVTYTNTSILMALYHGFCTTVSGQ